MSQQLTASLSFLARVTLSLARRPDLIGTALRQGAALVPKQWWKTSPRLPLPRPDYLEFRNVTLSGEAGQLPEPHDVIVYLDWCKSMRALPDRA